MMTKNWKKLAWQWRGVWIATPTVTVLVILLRTVGVLQAWEWGVYDQFLRWRPGEPPDERIVVVGLDEGDIQAIGQGIVPDAVYAELIGKLREQNPRAIGWDIYRDQPVNPGYEELVEVLETTPNLIGIQKVVGDRDRETVPPPPALAATGRVGFNDLVLDPDGRVRRALISLEDEEGNTMPSFATYLAALYFAAEGIAPEAEEATGDWKFKDRVFRRIGGNIGGYVGADVGGYQIVLNYRAHPQPFEVVPFRDVLQDRLPEDWGRDRIILIGSVSESSKDFFFTPYSSDLLSPPVPIPGVKLHGHIISQILSTVLEGRTFITSWAEPWDWAWIALWALFGSTSTWLMRHTGGTQTFTLQRIAVLLGLGLVLVGSSYVALLYGWWIPVVPPFLAFLGSTAAITTYIARSAGDIRKTFGRYLTAEVVATLLENPEGLKMGGERRKITILTSDLRGFTALSERLPPEEVVKILNFYLGYMADTITAYQGTIDEFMGDGILVLFGAPTVREDDPRRAIACAIAMQQAMTPVNEKMEEWGLPLLEMGIGINTGEVVVGNIGSEKRTKYGVVGSQVNLTYRIEGYTIGGQVLVSETTLQAAGDEIKINGQKEVSPKGVKKPITIYDIGGIGGEYNLFLEQDEEELFVLPEPLPLQYAIVSGKDVGQADFKGHLSQLSKNRGEITYNMDAHTAPLPLTNIKLNFLASPRFPVLSEDVYAKVLEKDSEPGKFYIQFTSKPPNVSQILQDLYHQMQP
nr:adenylate/guanylate cyclase domain-containing protein [Spirulina subsalsa]